MGSPDRNVVDVRVSDSEQEVILSVTKTRQIFLLLFAVEFDY